MEEQTLRRVVELLSEATTLPVVRSFLQERGLPHSAGSWSSFEHDRLRPYLANGRLTEEDIFDLLRLGEEYGKQHIFLYKASPQTAVELLDYSTLQEAARQQGVAHVLDKPDVLSAPEEPTVVDIRLEGGAADDRKALVIKLVEARTSLELVDFQTDERDRIIKTYQRSVTRGVNVVRLHRDGLLEIRIGSHTTSSRYKEDLKNILELISFVIPIEKFYEIHLHKLKDRLWTDRETLKQYIRYSDSTLRNGKGTVLKAATGSTEADLYEDTNATSSVKSFLTGDAYFDGSNIWFRKDANGLSREVHVLLSGLPNEFAVPAHCPREDYEHVLGQIRQLNG